MLKPIPMKKLLILFYLIGQAHVFAQNEVGTVQSFVLHSEALVNLGGENPNPKVSVYLPDSQVPTAYMGP